MSRPSTPGSLQTSSPYSPCPAAIFFSAAATIFFSFPSISSPSKILESPAAVRRSRRR
jgi:hypothetical protein